jgi:hypothetical protein
MHRTSAVVFMSCSCFRIKARRQNERDNAALQKVAPFTGFDNLYCPALLSGS